VSEDGNYHDRDDICAAPIILAILSKTGNASNLVYYGYNDHFWLTDSSREAAMRVSTEQTATIWSGFNANAFFSVTANSATAVNALTGAINESTSANPLTIIAAGPMQVIGMALAQSNATARQFVTVISHSSWNDTHATSEGAAEGLTGTGYSFAMLGGLGANLVHIKDQNAGLARPYSEWFWLRDSSDSRLNWLWQRGQAAAKSDFDCSDAGMAYYLVTGDASASPAKLELLLGGSNPTPSPTATPTPSPSPSTTPKPTPTPSASPSSTPTATPTPRPTATPTPQPTPTPTVTPSATPTPTPAPSPTPSPTPSGEQAVTSFALVNADTNQPVAGYETLCDGAIVDLDALPACHLNIRANTNSSEIGSVRFAFDDDSSARVENVPPFALFGDVGGDYSGGRLQPGQHTLAATPFTQNWAGGVAGTTLAISFTVLDSGDTGFSNGSARSYVAPNGELISGFIIAGNQPKTVVLRALGSSLSRFGIHSGLADPTLELHDAAGALIAVNDNWRDSQQALFEQRGRFHSLCPPDNLEPAIAIQLQPGSYSAIVRGKNGGAGGVVAEMYDVSDNPKLANVSTRAAVAPNNVLIGGFVVQCHSRAGIILRALGPSLSSSGVTNVLSNPSIAVFNQQGYLVGYNEHWQENVQQAAKIARSGLAPSFAREPAMALNLPSGSYTAVVRGQDNSAGVALLDIYNVP